MGVGRGTSKDRGRWLTQMKRDGIKENVSHNKRNVFSPHRSRRTTTDAVTQGDGHLKIPAIELLWS